MFCVQVEARIAATLSTGGARRAGHGQRERAAGVQHLVPATTTTALRRSAGAPPTGSSGQQREVSANTKDGSRIASRQPRMVGATGQPREVSATPLGCI